MYSRRGKSNFHRDIAIWLVRRHCRKTLAEVGEYFGLDNYSSVSSALERVKARRVDDRYLKKHLKALETKLNISQKQT